MSRAIFRKPDFRLALDYPNITLCRAGRPEPVGSAMLDSPDAARQVARLGAAAGGARVTVVLPADEVWRGTIELGKAGRR